MLIGVGYDFKFGDLNVPVSITYVPSQNRTYHHDEERDPMTDEIILTEYSVTHPTGARVSIMVGFNLSK